MRTDSLTSKQRSESRKLRHRVRQLEFEDENLGNAGAWFAKEAITPPLPFGHLLYLRD